eukprot:GAFH01001032.1.p1 GENE.GAFH01001032.1~~GAFH01001032.1.p1  ORF type:complete len:675 (-),score=245.13 GAFH01001032.1:60-2042(-)
MRRERERRERPAPAEPSLEAPDTSSLLYHCRTKILDHMLLPISGIPERVEKQNVLILDDFTIRIISESIKTHELTEKRVLLVEKVTANREALPAFDAIYFVTPQSVDEIVKDFQQAAPAAGGSKKGAAPPARAAKYRNVHIFLTSGLGPAVAQKIQGCPALAQRVRTLSDCGLDFYVEEKAIYSTNQAALFPLIFAERPPQDVWMPIALKLVSVCVTLGVDPVVRYIAGSGKNPSLSVARMFRNCMATYKERNASFREAPGPKYTLLVLDRIVDILSPVLHDFSYRSMIYECIEATGHHLKTKFTSASGAQQDRDIFLNEGDSIWVKNRHLFMGDAFQNLQADMRDFNANNDAAQCFQDGHISPNVRNLGVAIQKLPEYQRLNEKFGQHIQLAEMCNTQVDRRQLNDIATLEQDMAYGMCVGQKVRGHVSRLTRFLQAPNIMREDKLRLLLVHLITTDSISREELQAFVSQARIPPDEARLLDTMRLFGVEADAGEGGRRMKKQRPPRDRVAQQQEVYQVMQYIPVIEDIVRDFIEGRLSDAQYPSLDEGAATATETAAPAPAPAPSTGRGAAKGFAMNWTRGGAKAPRGGSAAQPAVRPLLIYLVGGVTSEEMRAIDRIRKEFTRGGVQPPIFLGGSEILYPKSFVEHLREMSRLGQSS